MGIEIILGGIGVALLVLAWLFHRAPDEDEISDEDHWGV